jgi:hypothetical protein
VSAAVLDQQGDGHSVVHIAGRHPARVRRELLALADLHALVRHLNTSDEVSQLWCTVRWSDAHPIADVDRAWLPVEVGPRPAAVVSPSLNRRLRSSMAHATGAQLLEAIVLYSRSLGVSIAGSPGQTAEALLRGILARREALEPLAAVDTLPAVVEPVLSWIRPLLPDEAAQPWFLAIDRRGAYLHSMALTDLGIGEPVQLDNPDWPEFIWTAGYYLTRLAPWREVILPDPIRCNRQGDEFWLTMPALRLAVALGMVLEVRSAWVWPRKSRVLLPIAERITRARRDIDAGASLPAAIATALLKRAYVELVGRLRMDAHRGTALYRPDWHAAIVADSRARVFRGALELANVDRAPAACAIDCWYVLAPTPEMPPGLDPKHWRFKSDPVPASAIGVDDWPQSVGELQSRVLEASR